MIEISLTQGEISLIDDEDFEEVSRYKWRINRKKNSCYARTNATDCNGKKITLFIHQLVMNSKPGDQVDHKDHNGLNNQKYNLRFCTYSENQQNKLKQIFYDGKKTLSKYKGVSWHRRDKKWIAQIVTSHKNNHLGYFVDEIEAAEAYNKAALEKFGEFAELNKIGRKVSW